MQDFCYIAGKFYFDQYLMKLTFWGAARQVTGSMFLLELQNDYKILIDCGADLSRSRHDAPLFPCDPREIDLVLLTHAHLDHSGNIPNLLINGYRGQVLCTSATCALAEIILRDSAMIHTKNLRKKANRKRSKDKEFREFRNAYLEHHVEEAANQFVTIAFNQRFEVSKDVFVTFIPAGHLLGAANILLEVNEGGVWKKIAFSGDIGRKNYPLLQDPETLPEVDYLVCETTYGVRAHSDGGNAEELLREIIQKACVDIPGRLIVPAFSVGRTQSFLYTLNKLAAEKKLPSIKVFADSPMAEQSTKVYEDYLPLLNEEAREFHATHRSLFDFDNLTVIRTAKESRQASNHTEPSIVIASSGMVSGGRIEDHIKKNLSNPYCTILMIGYAAEGTAGYQLLHDKTVTIKGRNLPVMASIIRTDVFSGHGDKDDLLDFVKSQPKEKLKKIFLVHGEYESMIGFKKTLEEEGYRNIEMPKKGESYNL